MTVAEAAVVVDQARLEIHRDRRTAAQLMAQAYRAARPVSRSEHAALARRAHIIELTGLVA